MNHRVRAAAMSKFQLSRLFKDALRASFKSFLVRVRVGWATEYLPDATRSIADVALAVGFKDERHFRRVFRKATGMSPSAYRRTFL